MLLCYKMDSQKLLLKTLLQLETYQKPSFLLRQLVMGCQIKQIIMNFQTAEFIHSLNPNLSWLSRPLKNQIIQVYKERIKQLRQELREEYAYKIRVKQDIQDYDRQWWVEYCHEETDKRIKELKRQVKRYEWTVNPKPRTNGVTDSDIQTAKEYPIGKLLGGIIRRSGQGRLTARCIFHAGGQERTPSLTIYPDQTWHCFGCQEHGDSIDFVMKREQLTFIEAVKYLTR